MYNQGIKPDTAGHRLGSMEEFGTKQRRIEG